jgi:hypothetical protein
MYNMYFDTFIDKPKPMDGKDAIVAFGNSSSPNFFIYKCYFPQGIDLNIPHTIGVWVHPFLS